MACIRPGVCLLEWLANGHLPWNSQVFDVTALTDFLQHVVTHPRNRLRRHFIFLCHPAGMGSLTSYHEGGLKGGSSLSNRIYMRVFV